MTSIALRTRAPGKINLTLLVGPTRADGLHELVSLVQPVSLADDLELASAPGAAGDEVICPGVPEPNLAALALAAYRRRSRWTGEPVRVTITKRVPVAGGMGGGSADAAATLRLAARARGLDELDPLVAEIAPRLGADVPALLEPGLVLVSGAGEHVDRVPARRSFGIVVVPLPERLPTAEVYREADRLGLPRETAELTKRREALAAALRAGDALPSAELLVNDLQDAARSLCPAIDDALAAVRRAGAPHALVSGSGPTVAGLFPGPQGDAEAVAAVDALAERYPDAVAARPVGADFAAI